MNEEDNICENHLRSPSCLFIIFQRVVIIRLFSFYTIRSPCFHDSRFWTRRTFNRIPASIEERMATSTCFTSNWNLYQYYCVNIMLTFNQCVQVNHKCFCIHFSNSKNWPIDWYSDRILGYSSIWALDSCEVKCFLPKLKTVIPVVRT